VSFLIVLTISRHYIPRTTWDRKDALYALSIAMLLGLLSIGQRFGNHWISLISTNSDAPPIHSRIFANLCLLTLVAGHLSWALLAPLESRRILWLWPLECLYIAFALLSCCSLVSSRWIRVLAVSLVILGLMMPARHVLQAWYLDGWGGRENPVITLLDRLADHHKRNGDGRNLSLSYDKFGRSPLHHKHGLRLISQIQILAKAGAELCRYLLS
jgi:hypothetical protein